MASSSRQKESIRQMKAELRLRVAERFRKNEISFDQAMSLIVKIRQGLSRTSNRSLDDLRTDIEAAERDSTTL